MRERAAQERAAVEDKAAKEREVAERKAAQRRAVAEEKAGRERRRIIDQYQLGLAALSGKTQPTLSKLDPIKRLELDEFLGRPVAGYACFLDTPFGWQLKILQELIRRDRTGDHTTSTDDLLNLLIERNCVRSDFRNVSEEMERTIASCGAAYRSPYRAVDFFLQFLAQRSILAKRSNGFAIASAVSQKLKELRDQDRKVFERRDRVIQLATSILDRVPPEYRGEVTPLDWLEQEIADHGISFSEAIESNCLKFHKMLAVLENIYAMFFKGGAICLDTLDLPISQARELEVEKRRLAEIESQRRREEADRLAGQARRLEVSHKVFNFFEKEGLEWMELQRRHFKGVDVLTAVERSEDDYFRAINLIKREIDRRN